MHTVLGCAMVRSSGRSSRIRRRTALAEHDNRAAEATPRKSCTVHSSSARGNLDKKINFGQRNVEVVSHRRVRFEKQIAESGCILITNGLDRGDDASVLGHHMSRASVEWFWQQGDFLEIVEREIA